MITKSLHRLWQHRQPMMACLLGLSVISGLIVASYASAQSLAAVPARLVTVVENGRERAVYSTASSVRELIATSGMEIDASHDSVSPHLDASLAQAAPTVTIQRARLVTVIDGKKRSRVLTAARVPQDIAKAAGVVFYREDRVSFQTPGNIALDGPSEIMTIHRAPTHTVTAEEPIAFATEIIKDKQQFIGSKTIKRAGQPGIRRLTYTVEMKDGAEVQRRLTVQTVVKQPTAQIEVVGTKPKNPLTKSKGAHHFTDSKGVSHRETYYDLPMNVAMHNCGGGTYTIRGDGAKVDKDGYILVAANYSNYPRCSVVETSMGPGKVYDTGSFATKHPHGFDLATDWTKADGK